MLYHSPLPWLRCGRDSVESAAFFCSAPVGALTFLMQQLQMFTSISNLLLDILTYFAWNLTFLLIENVFYTTWIRKSCLNALFLKHICLLHLSVLFCLYGKCHFKVATTHCTIYLVSFRFTCSFKCFQMPLVFSCCKIANLCYLI